MIHEDKLRSGAAAPVDPGWLPDGLGPREREEARLLAESLSAEDAAAVVRFGSGIQQDIADFAASVLSQVRARDAGDVGESVTELVAAIREAPRGEDEERRKGLAASIPALGKLLARTRRGLDRSKAVEAHVEAVRAKLDEAYIALQKDIEMLDLVLKTNYDYFRKLDIHIAAAQLRLKEAEEEELPALRARAEQGSDPWDGQQLAELQAFMGRLEQRLDDFRRTRYLSLSQAPRIRMLQQSAQVMMEKIQSVLYNLIPLWKMDLVAGIAQHRADRALEVHRQVIGGIEASMRDSAERTRRIAAGIARESESGLVGMDTLRSVHEELLATLEDTIRIHADGRRQRAEAERELHDMERELRMKIAELANRPLQ